MEIKWKEPMTTGWEEVEKRRNTKTGNYADPTPEMMADPTWNAIYEEIRDWDINVPSEYAGYCSATGNHASAIFNAIAAARIKASEKERVPSSDALADLHSARGPHDTSEESR